MASLPPDIDGLIVTPPTKAVPFPLVLVDGEEHSGKSWTIAEFTKSDLIGPVWWVPLNEGGTADHYGRIDGTTYGVVRLATGDYHELIEVITKIRAKAQQILDAGGPPAVLVIDSASGIWAGLADWVTDRARASKTGQRILNDDPHAEVPKPRNLWNDANMRWHRLQALLKTFPGIVIVTARGKEVSATDEATGQPAVDPRTKQAIKKWSTQVNGDLPYAVDVWLRMRRDTGPAVVDVRSVEHGVKPGTSSDPIPVVDPKAEGRLLEWLIFDTLGLDLKTAYVGDFKAFAAGSLTDGELSNLDKEINGGARNNSEGQAQRRARPTAKALAKRIAEVPDDEALREVWTEANRNAMLQVDVETPGGMLTIDELIRARHEHFVDLARKARGENLDAQRQGERTASAAAVAAAWDATSTDPRTPEEAAPEPPADERTDQPDPPELCKAGAPRRGVLASLQEMEIGPEEIAARYGRPVEQVATTRLRELVARVIAERRQEVPA